MKAADIVLQLAAKVPQFTDLFTTNSTIVSMVRTTTTMLVTTSAAHGFTVGQGVSITGSQVPITIDSLTRIGTLGILQTDFDHDVTLGAPGAVEISGATEPEFNGAFTVVSVPNRREIKFTMVDTGPTVATGSPILENGASALQQFNGLFSVDAVPTSTSFEYTVPNSSLLDPIVSASTFAKSSARVSAALSLERISDAYTKQEVSDLWMFVVLNDTSASKNRTILSDATDNIQRSQYYRQQLLQTVSVYVVIPTSGEIAARQARDLAEDIFRPICQSILFERFDTQLFVGKHNPLHFLSHGFALYNTSYYIHQYVFEQVADLQFEDTIGFSEDVAFRDIFFDMGVDLGTARLTAEIDLDEEPIP